MHGLGAAGDCAVPFLLSQLPFGLGAEGVVETDSRYWGTDGDNEWDPGARGAGGFTQQSCTIGAVHALGQCALSPDAAVVDGLIGVIDSAMLQLDLHARQELLPAAALGEDEDGPVFAAEDFDFVALERRRAVAEAACSLGLVGQRVLSAATDAETGAEEQAELGQLVLRVVSRLVGVITAPEPAEEVPSYLWENTARNNAALALIKLCSDARSTRPTLPNFRGVRGPDRFLYGMVCDAQQRLAVRHSPRPHTLPVLSCANIAVQECLRHFGCHSNVCDCRQDPRLSTRQPKIGSLGG